MLPRLAVAGSASLMGPLGLIIVPSARMEESGTIRAQIGAAEPYAHAAIGVQLAAPLWIGLRQTARATSLRDDPERLYPGVDVKLRLLQETAYSPALAIGWQSAIGHKRMAGEYLSLSKHYENWDFTAGIAWGRLGSAAHISNPLKVVSSHFGKARARDGDMPNGPEDWFTGKDAGFFAGVEYNVPGWEDLRLKAEWGADRYVAEQAAFEHDVPKPWAVGFSYRPLDAVDFAAGLIGGDRVMARLSVQGPVKNWSGRGSRVGKPQPLRPYRAGIAMPEEIIKAAAGQDIVLRDAGTDQQVIWARMEQDPYVPLPLQWGRAGRVMANKGGAGVEALEITPLRFGLRGPSVRLLRRDLEQALARGQGSPQEIWRNTQFNEEKAKSRDDFFTPRWTEMRENLRFIWDTQMSLAEEDQGVLYRTALLTETQQQITRNIIVGGGLRFNLAGNLQKLNLIRPVPILPVREDVDVFTANIVNLERFYMAGFKSFNTDLHVMFAGGYLEEMYAGAGGEILYRPFGKTWAVGAEAWQVFKRDPWTSMAQGLNGDHILSGHLNGWYEVPASNLTFHAKIGRYLAGDVGGTLSLRHHFMQGGHIEAFATATNGADFDPFGGVTHIYSGLRFTMPVGNVKYINKGSEIRMTAAHLGRQSGQVLERPLPLYDMTADFSLRQIARDWTLIGE